MDGRDFALYVVAVTALFAAGWWVQGGRRHGDAMSREERISALAMAKTLTFFALHVPLAVLGGILWFGTSALRDVTLGVWVSSALVLEALLLAVVLQLPPPTREMPAISRRRMAAAFSVLALVPWLFMLDAATLRLIRVQADLVAWSLWVSGVLCGLTLAFFLIESILRRQPSWRALAAALVPAASFVAAILWR